MKKPKPFFCEIYKTNIFYFIKWKPEDFKSYLKKKQNIDLDLDGRGGYAVEFENGFGLWTCQKDKNNCYLVHECVHVAGMILFGVGIHADHKNDEALAYLAELLFKKAIS